MISCRSRCVPIRLTDSLIVPFHGKNAALSGPSTLKLGFLAFCYLQNLIQQRNQRLSFVFVGQYNKFQKAYQSHPFSVLIANLRNFFTTSGCLGRCGKPFREVRSMYHRGYFTFSLHELQLLPCCWPDPHSAFVSCTQMHPLGRYLRRCRLCGSLLEDSEDLSRAPFLSTTEFARITYD